jgi:hypothetical protein
MSESESKATDNCCSTEPVESSQPSKMNCGSCGRSSVFVKARTILHHIKSSWELSVGNERFFFCPGSDCEVAYFGDGGTRILVSDLRTKVGLKDSSDQATLCYCFGVQKRDIDQNPTIREFVVSQTKLGQCSCEVYNPSGQCCLKDFPKAH